MMAQAQTNDNQVDEKVDLNHELGLQVHYNDSNHRLRVSIIAPEFDDCNDSSNDKSTEEKLKSIVFGKKQEDKKKKNEKDVKNEMASKRLGSVICCVVDISGSMSINATFQSEKGKTESTELTILDLVKHSIKTIIHCLTKDDYLAIVSFSDEAKIVSSLLAMTEENKKDVLKKLDDLEENGQTNLWGGLELGLNELFGINNNNKGNDNKNENETEKGKDNKKDKKDKKDKKKKENKKVETPFDYSDIEFSNCGVLLFTDGEPNIGPTKCGDFSNKLKEYLTNLNKINVKTYSQLPCVINTYGFGYRLDGELLNEIALIGNGNYFFIPDSSFVGTIFVNSISNFVCNIAKHVELNIRLNESNNKLFDDYTVMGHYKYEFDDNTNTIKLFLGSIVYEQNKDIIIQFGKSEEKEDNNDENSDANNDNNNEGNNNDNAVVNNNNNNNNNNNLPFLDISKESLEYISLKNKVKMNKAKTVEYLGNGNKNDLQLTEMNYLRLLSCDTIRDCIELMNSNTKELNDQSSVKMYDLCKLISKNKIAKHNEYIKDLLKDLRGEVTQAISTKDIFNKWGKFYLYSLIFAHLHQCCNNFKDPGVQHYGGKLFKQIRKQGDEIFVKLPAPQAKQFDISGIAGLDLGGYGHGYGGYGGGHRGGAAGYGAPAPRVNMNNFYNAGGGCIAENCYVLMADDTTKLVQHLKSGDKIKGCNNSNNNNNEAEIECVIKMKCENNEMHLSTLGNGLRITSWHPIKWNNKWIFPNDIDCGKMERCNYVYNFVLKKGNGYSMIVNGIECVTLGHNINNDKVLKHDYFGSDKVIDDLKLLNGWNNGLISLNSTKIFKRNENTNVVVGMVAGMVV